MKSKLTLCLLALTTTVLAQNDTVVTQKIITNAKMISVGATNILDTYLSPEHYTGAEIRFISHTTREKETPNTLHPLSPVSRQLTHQGYVAFADNRSGNGNEIAGAYDFQYAIHYNWNWQLAHGSLQVKAGGMVEGLLGFTYNTRNSNNPAQARAFLNIGPSAAAAYKFDWRKFRFVARYEVSLPLAGVMFSPNYGQSYYEIFSEGNYDHNIVPTTIFSTPSYRHMLTADLNIKTTTIRIGWLADIQQAEVNHLKQHTYTNALMIGIVKKFKYVKLRP